MLGHAWGLYPINAIDAKSRSKYIPYLPPNPDELEIPADHILVAKVGVLREVRAISPRSTRGRNIEAHMTIHRYSNGFRMFDTRLEQAVQGINSREKDETGTSTICEWLIDIEPRLGLPPASPAKHISG